MHLKDIFEYVAHFVSVSILLATLGFLNNYRQEARRRSSDKVQRTRELLSELRTAAYLTVWTSLGDRQVDVFVLRIRDEIAKRVPAPPTAESIRELMADQCLREAIVHDAFKTSGLEARTEQDVAMFSRFRGGIAFANAAVEVALDAIESGLRVQLLHAAFVVHAMRDKTHPLRDRDCSPADVQAPLAHAHRMLRGNAELPNDERCASAYKLIEKLGDAVLHASGAAVLRLYGSPGIAARARAWRAERHQARRSSTAWARLRAQVLAQSRPQEVLAAAIDSLAAERRMHERSQSRLVEACAHLAKIFKDTEGGAELAEAADGFLKAQCQKDAQEHGEVDELLALKARGVDDPDIDLFLATMSGVTALAESALARGANPNVGILAVIRRHRAGSADRSPAEDTEQARQQPAA